MHLELAFLGNKRQPLYCRFLNCPPCIYNVHMGQKVSESEGVLVVPLSVAEPSSEDGQSLGRQDSAASSTLAPAIQEEMKLANRIAKYQQKIWKDKHLLKTDGIIVVVG